MEFSFEQALMEVWRQVLVENADVIDLGKEHHPVRRTLEAPSCEVDFVFEGNVCSEGLEQNPEMKSRWAKLA